MTPEAREFIKHAGFGQPTVEQLAAMLPEDDLELDAWIAEVIRNNDSMGFHLLAFAALSRGRPVDARHLATAAKLSGGALYLAAIAFRVQGEMPEYLMEGLQNSAIHHASQAMGLLAIAVWCDERREGVYPDQLVPKARALARQFKQVIEMDAYLLEVAARTKDTMLEKLVREHYPISNDAKWQTVVVEGRKVAAASIQAARGQLSALLHKEPVFAGQTATTVRRSVSRIGRNDPCHCGSGKKYKHCHYEKDRERLQQSSEVAGLTQAELSADSERHLTLERLERKSGPEIAAMDAAAIPRHLLTHYFVRLAMVDLDQAATNLEKLGYDDDLEDSWFFTMFTAVRANRKDIGDRLFQLRRPHGLKEEDLRLSQRLLLSRDNPGSWLHLVEEAAREGLKTEDSSKLTDLAFAVTHSDATALGLIIYRGVLPFIPPDEVRNSYDDIVLPLRERIKLPAEDPLKEFLDNRGIDAELALEEAEAKFEAKRREVRELRDSLEQIQKELARRESAPAPESPAPQPPTKENDERMRQLRDKVKQLESDLKERHNERNELRRKLDRMQSRADALVERAVPAENSADGDVDNEDELLLAQDSEGSHPFRLIDFPRNFLQRLEEFPHHVARSAMAILGKLAGGDPAVFSGAKRLKAAPSVMRVRVGIDFRLLFRLQPERIEVVDLIPRQDLERKIKTIK